jgi:hypothetical protein
VIKAIVLAVVVGVPGAGSDARADTCVSGHGIEHDALATMDFDTYHAGEPQTALPAGTYRVGEIRYIRQNVFPDQNNWLARQANRFNVLTREAALSAALPFATGAVIDDNQRREAERVLRGKPYLYDALVLVREICGDEVKLDVVVRDVWTFTPNLGVSRAGGENAFVLGLSDVNLLGTGKSVWLQYFDDEDRSGSILTYDDPNLWGSRWAGTAVYADNDDGGRYGLNLTRPFFALDTPFATGFAFEHVEQEQDLDFLGEDEFTLDAESDTVNLFVGRSGGRRNGWVNRYIVGYRYVEEQFEFPADFPGPRQTRREFSYPYLAWQRLEDRFVERTNVERVGITEDLALGWSSYAEVGWSSETFGGEGDYVLGRASVAFRDYLSDQQLLTFGAQFRGRYNVDDHRSEDVVFNTSVAYLWAQAPKWRFYLSARYTQTRNLPADKQLTLGGDTGLRGYPSRYQPGDRSYLFTVEQRYHSDAEPLGLLRLGYAVFVDVGRAWFADDAPAWMPPREGDHFDHLINFGVGLRLESIRTRRDRILHIDLAKPLVDGPFVETWELTVSGKAAI